MRVAILGTALALALAAPAFAQDRPAPSTPAADAPKVEAPAVDQKDAQAVRTLALRVTGLTDAMAVLQEKVDATTADLNRVLARMQAACASKPDFELSPQTLACAPKAKPDPTPKPVK